MYIRHDKQRVVRELQKEKSMAFVQRKNVLQWVAEEYEEVPDMNDLAGGYGGFKG